MNHKKLYISMTKIPSLGPFAARKAMFTLLDDKKRLNGAIETLQQIRDCFVKCSECFGWHTSDPCYICTNKARNHDLLCVVENSNNMVAIEETGTFNGVYLVIGDSALQNIEIYKDTSIKIIDRIKAKDIKNIIFVTKFTYEKNITLRYITDKITQIYPNIKIQQPAFGMPVGVEIEYIDKATLSAAIKGCSNI